MTDPSANRFGMSQIPLSQRGDRSSPAWIKPSKLLSPRLPGSRPGSVAFCHAWSRLGWVEPREAFTEPGVLLESRPCAIERSDIGPLRIRGRPALAASLGDMAARLRLGGHLALLLCISLFQGGRDQLGGVFGHLRMRRRGSLPRVIPYGRCRHSDGPACVNDHSFRSLQFGIDADPGKVGSRGALGRGRSRRNGAGCKEQR